MAETHESIYVGSAVEKQTAGGKIGIILDLDLTELRAALNKPEIASLVREWESKKDGTKHSCIKLAIWPLQPQNVTEYKTHSVKVNTWKPDPNWRGKKQADAQPEPVPVVATENHVNNIQDDLPF